MLVDPAQLPQIGQLAGTGDITDGREQRILHDGTQEDAGAEPGRMFGGFPGERVGRVARLADEQLSILLANRATLGIETEERGALVSRLHLRVVAMRLQLGAGLRCGSCGVPGCRQLPHENLAHGRLRAGVRRVVHDQAALAEHLLEPPGKRIGHSHARLVCRAQVSEERRAELGGGKRLLEFVQHALNLIVQCHGGDRHGLARRAFGQGHRPAGEVLAKDRTRAHFVPVVVFRFNPEHGDRGHTVAPRDFVRELQRR